MNTKNHLNNPKKCNLLSKSNFNSKSVKSKFKHTNNVFDNASIMMSRLHTSAM